MELLYVVRKEAGIAVNKGTIGTNFVSQDGCNLLMEKKLKLRNLVE